MVGEATWSGLEGSVAGDALDPLRVKGKRELVHAWRLVTTQPTAERRYE